MRPGMKRAGVSTIELLIVMVIGGVVASTVGGVLRRQQRFFTNASSLVEQRVSLRDATGILAGELRALSPGGGDILAFSDSALEMRATIGTAIACDTVAGGGAIELVPAAGPSSRPLSAYTTSPQAGDVALVFDAAASDASAAGWTTLEVASASPRTDVCATSRLIDPASGAARLELRFASSARLPSTVRPGAFVRVLRRVRYRFYRTSASQWFLGYAEWDGIGFGGVQPVSGPYAPYSRGGGSGLSLRYFDRAGAPVTAPADAGRIARIQISVRGPAGGSLSGSTRVVTDSQAITVRVRNP
jgi:type II secretory pathway pseudopilin PulG